MSGFWPLAVARLAGVATVGIFLVAFASRQSLPFPSGAGRQFAAGAGLLDVTATTLLLIAVRHGLLVVVAPVVALAPAFTVMWAWIVLREPVSRTQVVGLALALVGLALIATS